MMSIQLAQNFWILIIFYCLELLLILVPIFISAKLEKKSIRLEFREIGFFIGIKRLYNISLKIILGFDIAIFLYLLGGLLLYVYRDILIVSLFGIQFVKQGIVNSINTAPLYPSPIEITVYIILQLFITAPSEEGFFRGFIIQKLNHKLKLIYSMLISSIIFALYHTPPFLVPIQTVISYFGYFFLIGLIFAIIFIMSNRSLSMCIITHSFFNILVLIL